ncbi:hypothetical protein BASA81_002195 [Batrachochytrium salamandrivorans]|nr:hypothetical protein BASA81_002195 [Batrachochytrium salamandrivorans]
MKRDLEKTPHRPRLVVAGGRSSSVLQTPQAFHRGVQNATELGLTDSKLLLQAIEESTEQRAREAQELFRDFVSFPAHPLSFAQVLDAILLEFEKIQKSNSDLELRLGQAERQVEELEEENLELEQNLDLVTQRSLSLELRPSSRHPATTTSTTSELAQILLQGDALYRQFMDTSAILKRNF